MPSTLELKKKKELQNLELSKIKKIRLCDFNGDSWNKLLYLYVCVYIYIYAIANSVMLVAFTAQLS